MIGWPQASWSPSARDMLRALSDAMFSTSSVSASGPILSASGWDVAPVARARTARSVAGGDPAISELLILLGEVRRWGERFPFGG